jgi:hypothetical protein
MISKKFSDWFDRAGPLSNLRREYETYVFRPENYVIRHLFAHFLAFQEDKFRRPEFFCWPGAWTAGDMVSEEIFALFEKHGALFVDKEHDDGVFPRLQARRDDAAVHAAYSEFYHHTAIDGLTDQWISKAGPFRYDLAWLSASVPQADVKTFLRERFNLAFGLDPEDALLIDFDLT